MLPHSHCGNQLALAVKQIEAIGKGVPLVYEYHEGAHKSTAPLIGVCLVFLGSTGMPRFSLSKGVSRFFFGQ